MLLYQDYIGDNEAAFVARVNQIAANLGVDPNWLMLIMYNESLLDPQSKCPSNGAGGLIGFLPSTAKLLGTDIDTLLAMNNLQQLDYVEKFFQYWKQRGLYPAFTKNAFELYSVIFFPSSVGKADNYVIATKGQKAYDLNSTLDVTKDGILTKADFRQWLKNKYPEQSDWFQPGTQIIPSIQPDFPTDIPLSQDYNPDSHWYDNIIQEPWVPWVAGGVAMLIFGDIIYKAIKHHYQRYA